MRLFFALELAPAAREAVSSVIARLSRAGADVRWTRSPHLTLAFLGEQPPERVGEAVDAARPCAGRAAPFELALSAPGTFSQRGKTRVLWLGAKPSPAEALAGELRVSLAARGFPPEKLPFKAHVSLGRVRTQRGAADLEAEIERMAAEFPPMPRSSVSELVLFESRLGPDGARHLPLERLALGAGR